MNKTNIEWTATVQPDGSILPGYSSNPIKYRDADGRAAWGCIKASAGCQNCYAAAISRRFRGPEAGFTAKRMEGLTPYVDEAELKAMLSPRRLPAGSKVFVGDMTDIFGPWVPFDMLDRLFDLFALRQDVTFQVLTKRPERMREYLTVGVSPMDPRWRAIQTRPIWPGWPLPNVWLGTSAEDQATADRRIPELLACPAAVRFVSAEPLLGAVDFFGDADGGCDATGPAITHTGVQLRVDYGSGVEHDCDHQVGLDWIIVGGESGPGARPCDISWIRSIVGQCKAAGTAVFVKQLGSNVHDRNDAGWEGEFETSWPQGTENEHPRMGEMQGDKIRVRLKSRKGGAMSEWPEDLRVREMPL